MEEISVYITNAADAIEEIGEAQSTELFHMFVVGTNAYNAVESTTAVFDTYTKFSSALAAELGRRKAKRLSAASPGYVSKCKSLSSHFSYSECIAALDAAKLSHSCENAYKLVKGSSAERKFDALKMAKRVGGKLTSDQRTALAHALLAMD